MLFIPSEEATDAREHGRRVAGMFGRIARFYDFLNHALSLGLDILWRRKMARSLDLDGHGAPVLDLAAGTLDVSLETARLYPGRRVISADFSLPMLQKGAAKIPPEKRGTIQPVLADARKIPLRDESVAAVTVAFGVRNIKPRREACEEVLRVLEPGGRFCILEFGTGKRKIWGGLYNFYLDAVLPGMGRLVSGDPAAYRYLAETIKAFPDEDRLAEELERAGFEDVSYQPMASGVVYLHMGVKPKG